LEFEDDLEVKVVHLGEIYNFVGVSVCKTLNPSKLWQFAQPK